MILGLLGPEAEPACWRREPPWLTTRRRPPFASAAAEVARAVSVIQQLKSKDPRPKRPRPTRWEAAAGVPRKHFPR